MKRSKLFLGISAGVLGVVAFTAAKVARFSGFPNAYYHATNSSFCSRLASLPFYSIPQSGTTPQATAGPLSTPAHAPLFTYAGGGACINKLYKLGAND
jgi:hypothetical protein